MLLLPHTYTPLSTLLFGSFSHLCHLAWHWARTAPEPGAWAELREGGEQGKGPGRGLSSLAFLSVGKELFHKESRP